MLKVDDAVKDEKKMELEVVEVEVLRRRHLM